MSTTTTASPRPTTFSGLLLAAIPCLQAQAPADATKTVRLHMMGNQQKLELLGTTRIDRVWQGRPLEAPAEFFVHVLDGQGKTLDRVPFSLPGARRSTWIKGIGPLSDPNRQHLALVDVPDHGAAAAEIRLERDLPDRIVRLATISAADVDRHAHGQVVPQGTTVRDEWISGPSANRFDICVLAAGYLPSEETQFQTDVSQFVQQLIQTEPFKHYRNYINVRSVFRESGAHACITPQQPINYGIRFIADSYQTCGTIDPNGFAQGQPANIQAVNADAALAGFDAGGVLVFVHSWAIPNQTIYGGLGQYESIAISTTNRVSRPLPFLPSLKFPALPIHELGHSIARLADETGTFGACPGRPEREPAPAMDFLEYNVSQYSDRRRWQYLWPQLPPQSYLGGLGCASTGGTTCVPSNVCLAPPGLITWSVYHSRPACMMNLLDTGFCPPCAEQLTLELNAGLDPVDSPLPASTSVTMLLADRIDFSWQDRTLTGTKRGAWTVNGNPVTAGIPGTSYSLTGAALGLGRHTVRVVVSDTTTPGSPVGLVLVGTNRRANLDGTRTWTVDVVDALAPGATLLSVAGLQGGYSSQLSRSVAAIGDWNKDGTFDVGITSAAGVHAVSGKTGANLFFAAASSTSNIPQVGGVRDVDSFGNDWLLQGETGPSVPVKAHRHIAGQVGQWSSAAQVDDLVALGDITGDNIPDFATVSADRLETFSGAVTIGSGGFIYQLPPLTPASWVLSLGDPRDGRAMQSLGYDDFNGNGLPDGDITGDGRAEFVTVAEDAHPGIGRYVRVYSVAYPPYQLWQVQLESIEHHWVATVGDVNQDGISDFLLATPTLSNNAGRVQLRSGLNGSVLRTHVGLFNGSKVGRGIAGVGDVDLDGIPDYAIARFGASNAELVEIRSGANGEVLSIAAPSGVTNGLFGHGKALVSVGDLNSDGVPDLAIGNGGEGSPGRLRVVSPVAATLSSPQNTINSANGGTQTFNIDMPEQFAGFGYVMAASLSGTAIPGIPYQNVRLPIVPDFVFTLGLEGSPLYTNPMGNLDPVNATATASLTVPSVVSSILLGFRLHHVALFFDPIDPTTVVEVTNAVYADFN